MSYQATAWAIKIKAGSAGQKAVLLALAHYANENGYCWPSQTTLAKVTEQSVDTVQRNLRRLEASCYIKRILLPRSGGRWSRHAYQLNMPSATRPISGSSQ